MVPLHLRDFGALKQHANFAIKVIMEPEIADNGEIKLVTKNRAMRGPSSFFVMVLEYLEENFDVDKDPCKTALLKIRRDIYREILLLANKDIMRAEDHDGVTQNDFPSLQHVVSARSEGEQQQSPPNLKTYDAMSYKTNVEANIERAPRTDQSTLEDSLKRPGGVSGGGDDGRRLPVMPKHWTVSDACFITLIKAYGIEILDRDVMDSVFSVSLLVLTMSDDGSIAPVHLRPERTHRAIVECVGYVGEKNIFGQTFNTLSKTRIRGVVGMLKASEVVVTASAGDENSPCSLALDPKVQNMRLVRKMVDNFLVSFVKEHHGQPLSYAEKEKLTWLLMPGACNVLAEGMLAKAKGIVKAFLTTYNEPAIHTINSSTQAVSAISSQRERLTEATVVTAPLLTREGDARPLGSYRELIPASCDDVMPSPKLLYVNTSIGTVHCDQEHSPMTTDEGAISPQDMLNLFSHQAIPSPSGREYLTSPGTYSADYTLWGQSDTSRDKYPRNNYSAEVFGHELIQALSHDTKGSASTVKPYQVESKPPGL